MDTEEETSGLSCDIKDGHRQSVDTSCINALHEECHSIQGLVNFFSNLGLEKLYPNKLSLRSLLEINRNSVYDETAKTIKDIPWCFLRKLFKINAECRSCTQVSNTGDKEKEEDEDKEKNNPLDFDLYTADDSADSGVNPLDLIVALFLCADSFLQQEMALKMSMCQFSVPLLLPQGNSGQCTLMLWALRDIVKEWRPRDMFDSRAFVEDSIVQADIPLYSFVRLKNCSLSKSQSLNHVLNLGHNQSHNIFTHRDMKGGEYERKLANGLVEVCWYLPSGIENMDKFPKPVAFANLRGDVAQSLTQFKFLLQVSTATFVFLDKVEEIEHKILTSLEDVRSKLFLVVNRKADSARDDLMSVMSAQRAMDLPNSSLIVKDPCLNAARFSEKLCAATKKSLTGITTAMNIQNMAARGAELGLSFDEHTSDDQRKAAEDIVQGIGVRSIPDYKSKQLPLQGDNWKSLSQLEKEECRLKKAGGLGLEEYKSQLQKERQRIKDELSKYKQSTTMKCFIEQVAESDKDRRDYFLKWIKIKLNANSRSIIQRSLLRNKLDQHQIKKTKGLQTIGDVDKALLESSLGIEHYMREMGLIYEFSVTNSTAADEISRLPGIAAQMLLDGFPLELLDGDASNIPERWVADVLMELHHKVGGQSRLLVLTVLGVQSTGKSTLLNTMFGVQFPVSSSRCTRGAYMLFLKVGEDMQSDMNCDFIVLIDTEGLKSPQLAQLEDSYEHDNQLATFVIGLSDVTMINVAMENSTEMKDVLQIATHAFLRMKQVGKKPVCHFVHQNVAAVSAHAKNMSERKHLLDQLNEMTQIAAEMEKQPDIKAFTDVLDYDIVKNNWNIPGLWHGTPPMAPVNTGYSEAVADFKKNLLEAMGRDRKNEISPIPEFVEWMKGLWKSVKYENFIFSFRNTLVAHAYDSLCKEFNNWEWEFRKEILSWQTQAELEISNADNESDLHGLNKLCEAKKSEIYSKITEQQTIMRKKLQDYYKRTNKHVSLIEKYKVDFSNSITCLSNEIQNSVNNKLDCALDLRKNLTKAQGVQRKYRTEIEKQVMKLLSDCKGSELSQEKVKDEFEKMWAEVTVNESGLKELNISAYVLSQLRKNLLHRKVNEELQNIGDLKEIGKDQFKAKKKHLKIINQLMQFIKKDKKKELQSFANSVIESCSRSVRDIAKTNKDYNDCFTKDLLDKIDEHLKCRPKYCNLKFEIDLKLHLCGIASREFLQMHRQFIIDRDPKNQLNKYKSQYLTDFLDLYQKKDHCQRKATDFVQCCIKPAVDDYINRSLGINIVDEILTGCHSAEYSSRSFFQYSIQRDLLLKEDFDRFLKYICNYEIYVKDWIFQHIENKVSEDKTLHKLKITTLQVIVNKITKALEQATKAKDGTLLPDNKESITQLISNMRKHLSKDISLSVEEEKTTLFQIQSRCHQFINSLKISINDMKKQLLEEFSNSEDIKETLNKLPIRPQDELFKRVFGCGRQCPFCKVPCEAGGKDHKQHHAAVHRPQGLGRYRYADTKKLVETLCTTHVHNDVGFRNTATNWEIHYYKDYTKFYPDWHIPPDPTIEASDYWKYVLVQYNDRFAQEYGTEAADVPDAWRSISKKQALKGLKDAFNIKGT